MGAENCDSMIIKETLKSLCCNNGWCYGIFWVFDQRKTLAGGGGCTTCTTAQGLCQIRAPKLLTLKDAYYEEQMGALIDSMLMQVHVLGEGVTGQVAFTQNHQWMHSDTHHQRQNPLASFENLEVFQDDSELYSQFCMGIKTIALISVESWGVVQFGSTHKNPETEHFVDQVKKLFREIRFLESEPSLHSQFLDSTTQFNSLFGISQSVVLPYQSFSSTSNHPIQISTNQFEDYLLQSCNSNLFDCSNTQALRNSTSYSVLTFGLDQDLSGNYEPCASQDLYKDILNTHNLTCLVSQTNYKDQRPSGLLTMEELFPESDFAKSISDPGLQDDDFSRWLSPQLGPNMSENLPTNSIRSSLTGVFRSSNPEDKCSGTSGADNLFDTWDETLVPAKTRTSNSLFSKLGLDQLLDGTNSCSVPKSGFEDQPSLSGPKRRKTDGLPSSHNRVKNESISSFDGKIKSLNPVFDPKTRNIGLHSEVSGSCIGDSSIMDACNTISSERQQQEPVKTVKKKAKPGTKPRPKDRQMIQDRLAELRELIPSGEKMSIDRLLERTITHLNFLQSLIKHADSLTTFDKPKSTKVAKNHSKEDSGGVTWACEVGNQSMVCPLIVEDLVNPGQMLIEILCEEQGFFMEIAGMIRGFGLIILKGAIEVREPNKIWAHFLAQAEGTRRVTRHEIFSSLIQLLQMSGKTNASDGFGNGISSSGPSFSNCQTSFPVNLSDALQCANL